MRRGVLVDVDVVVDVDVNGDGDETLRRQSNSPVHVAVAVTTTSTSTSTIAPSCGALTPPDGAALGLAPSDGELDKLLVVPLIGVAHDPQAHRVQPLRDGLRLRRLWPPEAPV
jgi:hypothetical protein